MYMILGNQKKKDRGEGFLTSLTTKLLKSMSLVDRQVSIEEDTEEFGKWGCFSWLPVSTYFNNVISVVLTRFHVLSIVSACVTVIPQSVCIKRRCDH